MRLRGSQSVRTALNALKDNLDEKGQGVAAAISTLEEQLGELKTKQQDYIAAVTAAREAVQKKLNALAQAIGDTDGTGEGLAKEVKDLQEKLTATTDKLKEVQEATKKADADSEAYRKASEKAGKKRGNWIFAKKNWIRRRKTLITLTPPRMMLDPWTTLTAKSSSERL